MGELISFHADKRGLGVVSRQCSRLLPHDRHDPGILFDPDGLIWAQPFNQFHDLTILSGDISMMNWFMMKDAVAKFTDIVTALV